MKFQPIDPDWREKVRVAREARELGRKLREEEGVPVVQPAAGDAHLRMSKELLMTTGHREEER